MNREKSEKSSGAVMLMISSCGQPVALVPAESVEQAQARALELLRNGKWQDMGLLTREAVVTLFSPVVFADGHAIAYLPTQVGSSHGFRDGRVKTASNRSGTKH